MEEIKIEPTVKEKPEEKEEKKEHPQEKEKKEIQETSDAKSILIGIAIIILLFIVIFGSFSAYNYLYKPKVATFEELHQQNINGELAENEGYMYNGFSFIFADGLWWTDIKVIGKIVRTPLHYGPRELQDIIIEGSLNSSFNRGDTVYVVIDPEVVSGHYVVAMNEISANIAQGTGRNSKGACSKNVAGCEDREILNCKNTQSLPVIELINEPGPSVKLKGTCIQVIGQDYDIIKSADRLLYQWYGVMD